LRIELEIAIFAHCIVIVGP